MNIYYTAYLVNNWKDVFSEQLNILVQTELLANAKQLYLHAYPQSDELYEMVKTYPNITLIFHRDNLSEIPAIHDLSNTDEDINLYFHSKGVTHPNSIPVKSWREYMNHFNLELWRECVDSLDHVDAVGVNLQASPYLHFSGNFWWATKKHISSIMKKPQNRADCEWYIASVSGKYISMHNSNIDHYSKVYDKCKWIVDKQLYQM